MIEEAAGRPVGALTHWPLLIGQAAHGRIFELVAGVSWRDVAPSVLRYVARRGDEYQSRPGARRFTGVGFFAGDDHAVYGVIPDRLTRVDPPGAFNVRVPDLAALLHHLAPALEAPLAASSAAGHTGELRLSYYRDGVRLALERGRLTTVEPWGAPEANRADAAFPGLTFLKLPFGYRTLDDLANAYFDRAAGG